MRSFDARQIRQIGGTIVKNDLDVLLPLIHGLVVVLFDISIDILGKRSLPYIRPRYQGPSFSRAQLGNTLRKVKDTHSDLERNPS
jgi:hypothetical protein